MLWRQALHMDILGDTTGRAQMQHAEATGQQAASGTSVGKGTECENWEIFQHLKAASMGSARHCIQDVTHCRPNSMSPKDFHCAVGLLFFFQPHTTLSICLLNFFKVFVLGG